MMERLTYVDENGDVLFSHYDYQIDDGVCITTLAEDEQYEFLEKLAERMAHNEQIIEKFDKLYLAKCEEVNRLKAELEKSVKLPCKVGDAVYAYCSAFGILEYYVDEINIGIETTVFLCSAYSEQCGEYQSECLDEIEPCIADFGKTVFLTLEEAQAKLEERNGGSNE
ncbi:hypothetical protein ACTQ6A_13880 [Lachnospiraceae bacterium LCP25S3_G4]